MQIPIDSFSLARGFAATATACGLKPNDALDMALIVADAPCSAAGLFTTNRIKAAPVVYDQNVLAVNAGAIQAVVVNAGNANACTGPQGAANCRAMAEMTAERLGCRADQVLVLSTGVIGRQLDMAKVAQGIAALNEPTAYRGAGAAARAIMTTDTHPKVAARTILVGEQTVTIAGMCKGAGMIHPNMATMLAIVTTDAQVPPAILDRALRRAADHSFNRVSVDGDTSTNDTLLLLASGTSGIHVSETPAPDELPFDIFTATLTDVCIDLAKQIARDGEGATRLVEITVSGAHDEQQAHQVANAIARSPLVKTAIHGGDPNWGRIVCAAGYSGAAIDPDRLALWFGPASSPIQLVANGLPLDADLTAASALLRQDPVFITLDLGLGAARTTVWTCDFSKEYVEINAHYTT